MDVECTRDLRLLLQIIDQVLGLAMNRAEILLEQKLVVNQIMD
jgi:hypothetical protein